jgi:hypothetical protein
MRHQVTVLQRCLGVILGLAGTMTVVDAVAEEGTQAAPETQSTNYTYSPDWAIVSAPPPPGPYQSVNVDPRVPGQEVVKTPFFSGLETPSTEQGGQQGDYFMGEPPAAGLPVPTPPSAYSGRQSYGPAPPPPGYYSSRGYNQRQPAQVQEQTQSYGYPRPVYPPYGYAPSPWTNPPAQRTEEEVPPPPAYNRMTVPPAPEYRYGPVPDQFYRRGSGTQ